MCVCVEADPYDLPELTAADFQRRASQELKSASIDRRRSSVGSRGSRKERWEAAATSHLCTAYTCRGASTSVMCVKRLLLHSSQPHTLRHSARVLMP